MLIYFCVFVVIKRKIWRNRGNRSAVNIYIAIVDRLITFTERKNVNARGWSGINKLTAQKRTVLLMPEF